MSEVAADQPMEKFRVVCPHCQKPFMVKLPTSLQVVELKSGFGGAHSSDLFSDNSGPLSQEDVAFKERVVKAILNKDFEIPLLPHVAVKVLRLSNDSNSDMQDLAKVIMTDQMMSAKIINIANSPVFMGTIEVTNIKQALVRVGVIEIRNMMLAVSMASKVFKSGMYSSLAKSLWEQAVGAAFAARVIAHGLRMDRELAFLCGLMHNLGKMIMLNILENCQRRERRGFKPQKQIIDDLWKQYSSDVGELAVSTWRLPDQIQKVVRSGAALGEENEDTDRMVAVTGLAGAFCQVKGIGQEPDDIELEKLPAVGLLQITGDACFELLERFYRTYDQMRNEFI